MKSSNAKILVSCDLEQKDYLLIGGNSLKIGRNSDPNHREKSPVIAVAKESKGEIKKGDVIVCHHNHFYEPSPYWLRDDLFSIPNNKTIFAIIDSEGNPKPVNTNIIAERFYVETLIPIPDEHKKFYIDRVISLTDRYGFRKGQLIFVKPYSPYEIVYVINGIERRVVKVSGDMVIGYEK